MAVALSTTVPTLGMLGGRVLFHQLLSGVTVLEAHQGIGLTGAQWDDVSGNGRHAVQGTGSLQPVVTGTLAGFPTATYDGTDDYQQSSLVLPAPGTTPTWFWAVLRVKTWVNNDSVIGDAGTANAFRMLMSAAGSDIRIFNGTASITTAGAANDVWVRMEAGFTNSTSDYLKIGAASTTGTNTGNLAGTTGRRIGFRTGGAAGNIEVAALMYTAGIPSTGVRAALDAAVASEFKGLVTL